MKKMIVVMIVLIVSASACLASGDIDGFRGIKWGTDISKMPGFKKVGTDPSYGGIDIFSRSKDSMSIGAAKLDSIQYGSWHGKFCNLSIKTTGYVNYQALLAASKEKFGDPSQPNQYIEKYYWDSDSAAMLADYNQFSHKGNIYMFSKEISKEQKEYDNAKAQEGADKGF